MGLAMQPSLFNVRVDLDDRGEVFLMNTLTDAQLVVSADVAALLDRFGAADGPGPLTAAEASTADSLAEHGFLVENRETDREALDTFYRDVREDTDQLRVTVLTTLQCNFACEYCIQGDHDEFNRTAAKMSMETAAEVVSWTEVQLDAVRPRRLVLMFFGGEPLLNLPVLYYVAERLADATRARGVELVINLVTNGLLLTREVVDRLLPLGLGGIKVTLDGDRDTHNRMRPLRGGQGTFDRIIENVRHVAGRCKVAIGGNFDETSFGSYPALLDFLREQEFADQLARVAFKPIIRSSSIPKPAGVIPLTAVAADGKPLGGSCMTAAGAGGSPCDGCHFVEDKMGFLREETKKRGFPTLDGVHMGPCEIHRRHAHTIGPDGSLYACPGFTGTPSRATGHIDGRHDPARVASAREFDRLAAWRTCGDCAFIPVCAGGCSVASANELGDMHTPTCRKSAFESALVSLAREVAASAQEVPA
jgi:uncharacterized protein